MTQSAFSKLVGISVFCLTLLASPRHLPSLIVCYLPVLFVEVCTQFRPSAECALEQFAILETFPTDLLATFSVRHIFEGPMPRTPGALEVLRRVGVLLAAAQAATAVF